MKTVLIFCILLLGMSISHAQNYKVDFDPSLNHLLIDFGEPIISVGSQDIVIDLMNFTGYSESFSLSGWNPNATPTGNILTINLGAMSETRLQNSVGAGVNIGVGLPEGMVGLSGGNSMYLYADAIPIISGPVFVVDAKFYSDTDELTLMFSRGIDVSSASGMVSLVNSVYQEDYSLSSFMPYNGMDDRVVKILLPAGSPDTVGRGDTGWQLIMTNGALMSHDGGSTAEVLTNDLVNVMFGQSPTELSGVYLDESGVTPYLYYNWNRNVQHMSSQPFIDAFMSGGTHMGGFELNQSENDNVIGNNSMTVAFELNPGQRDQIITWVNMGYDVITSFPASTFHDVDLSMSIMAMNYPVTNNIVSLSSSSLLSSSSYIPLSSSSYIPLSSSSYIPLSSSSYIPLSSSSYIPLSSSSYLSSMSSSYWLSGNTYVSMPANGMFTEHYEVMGPGVIQSEWNITVTSADESFYSAGNISWLLMAGQYQFDFYGTGAEGDIDITIHAHNSSLNSTISQTVTLSFQAPMAQHYIHGPTEIPSGGSSHFFNLNDYSDDPYFFNIDAISGDEGMLPSTMIHVSWTGAMLEVRVDQELPFGTDVYIDLVVENPIRNHTHSYQVRVYSNEMDQMNQSLNIIEAFLETSTGVPQIVTQWNTSLRVINHDRISVEAYDNAFTENHRGEFFLNSSENMVNGIETPSLQISLSSKQYNDILAWKSQGYFVKISFQDNSVQASDETISAEGWYSNEVKNSPRDPSAPFIENKYFNIGVGQTEYFNFFVQNPSGNQNNISVTNITSSNSSVLFHKGIGFNSYGEYQLELFGHDSGNVILEITISNGIVTTTEQLLIRVTSDIQYHGTFSTEISSDYSFGPNKTKEQIHVHINSTSEREGANFTLSAYSNNLDVLGNISTPNEGWNDLYINFDTYMQGEAKVIITISDDLGTVVERTVQVFVEENNDGPGPDGGGYCYGLCVSSVELEYEPGPGYLRMRWGEAVTVSTDGVLMVSGRIDGPSNGDTISIPFQVQTIAMEGNDVIIPITEQLKNDLIELEISHHDVEVNIPGNVFYSSFSGYPYTSGQRVYFEISQGPNFELLTAHYSSLDGTLVLEFDGELDVSYLDSLNGQLKIGTGGNNFKSIYYSNPSYEDSYDCGGNAGMGERQCTSEFEIYLTPNQKELIYSLGNKNGLYIHIDDGNITNVDNQSIVNSRFGDQIRMYYGTQFGDNWIESASLDIDNNRIVLEMDRAIVSIKDITFGDDLESADSLFMFFGIEIDSIDGDEKDNSDGTQSDSTDGGGDMPTEDNERLMFVRNSLDNIVISGTTVTINLSDRNKLKVEEWKNTQNLLEALLRGDAGFMIIEGAFTSTTGEKNVQFEHEATVLPFGNSNVDIFVSAPVIEVITHKGLAYFECIGGENKWFVTTGAATIPKLCNTGEYIYLKGETNYSVVAQDSSGNNSNSVTMSSVGKLVPDLYLKSNGTALLLGFVSEKVSSVKNATFNYSILKDGEVIDSASTYSDWGYVFYGEIGATYIVSTAISSIVNAEESFITNYSLLDTITVLAPTALTIPPEEWVMISNAGSVFDAGNLLDIEYIYKWDDTRVESLLYSKYATKDELSLVPPGQAFWFLSETAKTIPLSYSQDLVTVDLSHDDEGWNQVGNPYSFNLNTDAFGTSKEFFKWNGANYQKVNFLVPGEGYLTYVSREESIEILKDVAWGDTEFSSTQLFKQAVSTTQDWELGIRLTSEDNSLQDNYNTIGVKPLAENSRDEFDKYELPASMGSSVSLSFLQGDKAFRSEYKSVIEEKAVWKMHMGTTIESGIDATLEFDGLEKVRSLGYSLYLVDGETNVEITDAIQSVRLSESKEYSLVVSEGKFSGSLKQSFASVSNFPNPVKNITRFSIAIDDGAGAVMHLKVFDVKGTIVFNEDYDYAHELEWIPQSNNGKKLETGMYFYEINTGAHTVSNQMMILD